MKKQIDPQMLCFGGWLCWFYDAIFKFPGHYLNLRPTTKLSYPITTCLADWCAHAIFGRLAALVYDCNLQVSGSLF